MPKLNQQICGDWLAVFPAIIGTIFWVGFLWAIVEGNKSVIAGLPTPFAITTFVALLLAPLMAILCGLRLYFTTVEHRNWVILGLSLGLSPLIGGIVINLIVLIF